MKEGRAFVWHYMNIMFRLHPLHIINHSMFIKKEI